MTIESLRNLSIHLRNMLYLEPESFRLHNVGGILRLSDITKELNMAVEAHNGIDGQELTRDFFVHLYVNTILEIERKNKDVD